MEPLMFKSYDELYQYLSQKKCKDIALYDLTSDSDKSAYTFVISNPNAIANKKFAASFMEEFGIEDQPDGYSRGEWIIFDLDKFVIHSFVPQSREKYNLDKLWKSKRVNLKKKK